MTRAKLLDHELDDDALDLQAQRWAEQAEARSRQKAMLEARKREWRNAPPQASGLKPFSDLWFDVEAQRRGAITEDRFWAQVARSIHEGFFDKNRKLIQVLDEEKRLTSETLKPTLLLEDDDNNRSLIFAVVRNSWATIETLSEWARHHRYEIPLVWQSASDPLDGITKPKVRAAAKALRHLRLSQGTSGARREKAVNEYLKKYEDGMTVSPHTLKEARDALRSAESAAKNCQKLP